MKLFDQPFDPDKNLLPYDGIVHYYGRVFSDENAIYFFNNLLNEIEWEHDKAIMFGKEIITKRKVAWYGEKPFSYTYSKVTKYAKPWTKALKQIKQKVESQSGETYNSCLLNLYHSGEEGMAWHSDGEKDLRRNGAIASVSFGAERKFAFKHKESKEKVEVWLENGSLLVMKDTTQSHWLHRLPPTKKIYTPRVNLTFRTIVNE
jgi:alkylated DNA repair dioxygenase AlkB